MPKLNLEFIEHTFAAGVTFARLPVFGNTLAVITSTEEVLFKTRDGKKFPCIPGLSYNLPEDLAFDLLELSRKTGDKPLTVRFFVGFNPDAGRLPLLTDTRAVADITVRPAPADVNVLPVATRTRILGKVATSYSAATGRFTFTETATVPVYQRTPNDGGALLDFGHSVSLSEAFVNGGGAGTAPPDYLCIAPENPRAIRRRVAMVGLGLSSPYLGFVDGADRYGWDWSNLGLAGLGNDYLWNDDTLMLALATASDLGRLSSVAAAASSSARRLVYNSYPGGGALDYAGQKHFLSPISRQNELPSMPWRRLDVAEIEGGEALFVGRADMDVGNPPSASRPPVVIIGVEEIEHI